MGDVAGNFKYFIQSKDERTSSLWRFAARDAQLADLVEEAFRLPLRILHRWWGSPAFYEPALLNREHNSDVQASITLSPRYGTAVLSHCWLHELFHLQQDMRGLMPEAYPNQTHNAPITMLDVESDIRRFLLCEALAATEAIRASWRLKQTDLPKAWCGALRHPSFGIMARHYEASLHKGGDEQAAAYTLFQSWYRSPLRSHYEKVAIDCWLTTFRRNCNCRENYPPELPNLCRVTLEELVSALPNEQRYYVSESPYSIADSAPTASKQSQQLTDILEAYGKGVESSLSDVTNDSVIFKTAKF